VKVVAFGAAGLASVMAAAAAPPFGRLTEIPLRAGINQIQNFAPGGRDARIITAWRDNGNSHGYRLYLVLMPTKPGWTDWNVVGFETGNDFSDEIRDEPHTGEDVVTAVRFVREGLRRTPLVVAATRKWTETYYDRAQTVMTIYQLRRNDGGPGTQDYFGVAKRWAAKKRYCNAELALRDELRLPLPPDYGGPNKVDGCVK